MSFSAKQFRQALQQSNKIAAKFQKYIGQCKKSNMEVIYQMIEQFLKIISDKQSILLKVNAIFALTLCIQTCEYAIIEMIEAFLLPVLQDIALYQSDKRNYSKTSQYFKDKGYPQSTPNIEQLSHNYVTMVTNLVFLGAGVKESYYFFTDKLNLPSAFKQLANKLTQKGNEVPQNIQSQAQELQQIYQNNLYEFQTYQAAYVQFFKKRVSSYLLEGGRGRESLDIRKVLKNNDSWLTSQIIGSLHDALQDQNFQIRRQSLALLNELFIWGDVEAIMILNEGESIQHIYQKIVEAKGGLDLGRGVQIYPEIKGQTEHKRNFYVDYLRCLQVWAKLVPTAIYLNKDQDSKVLRLYNSLKDKNIVFPRNEVLQKFTKQFEENMKRNEQRNKYIITQLNDGQTSKNKSVASNRLSKYSQKISLIKEMRESTILSLSQIQKMIDEAQIALKVLIKSEREISKNMKTLNYFAQQFDKKFSLIQESVSQQHLQLLYERGCKCTEKAAQIEPYYSDYVNGKIDFKKFAQMLQGKFSQIDNSKSKSKLSNILSKLSKSKNSFSRDGLELSKSLHNTKKEHYPKQDTILERSVEQKSQLLHTQTQNNFRKSEPNNSGLSLKASKNEQAVEKKVQKSKLQSQGSKSRISKESQSSISNSHKSSMKSFDKQKSPTAKFILNTQQVKKQSQLSKKSSNHQKSPSSGVRANQYNQKTPYYPNQKKKQQFSDHSQWSSSGQQEQRSPKIPSKVEKSNQSNLKQQETKNRIIESKSREVFSDSSFSQYDESNQEIREAIDKSENPDFKMLFKDKTFQNNPSHNSKTSKLSKLQSQQHYAAVLQSLVPKPSQNRGQKSLSKISKDVSTSQLPPKSNFDKNNSKMDQKNYQLPEQYEYSREDSSSLRLQLPNKTIVNPPRQAQKSKSSHLSVKHESNSMYPPEKQKKSTISKASDRQYYSPSSSSAQQQYEVGIKNGSSKLSHAQSHNRSKLSKVRSEEAFKKKNSQVSEQNIDRRKEQVKQSQSKLQQIKKQKLNEIMQLQQRIQRLKIEQKQLFVVRSDWQSPTRPNTVRTALSPRFRNTNTISTQNNQSKPTYQSYPTEYYEENQQNQHKERKLQRHRNEQMNFDLVQLFKPPEGRLIYSRLYNKQISQLDIRERRKILKGKDLVFRNQDIEIGLMIHRDTKDLKIIYYVTASRFIKTFLFKLQPSTKLSIHSIPNQISNLQPKKQYRIYLFAQVLEFPYKMPQIRFKYHPQLIDIQEKLFISNQVNYFTSIIPFFFTKFMVMRNTTLEEVEAAFSKGVLRGEQTAYSKKLLPKHFYILQYFPDMVNIERKEYQNWYGVECEYGSTKFILKVVIKINKFMYIQGALTAFRDKSNSEKIMEYTICCINHLLSKTHQNITL